MAILELKNIEKQYHSNQVLKKVNLTVESGEIHALVGENGAGKSTLMNILFGMPQIFATGGFKGQIFFNDQEVQIRSPKAAMEIGIGMVHQEFMLIRDFTVAENIKLNREPTKANPVSKIFGDKLQSLDYKKITSDSKKALSELGIANIEDYTKVAGLSVGHKQFVEIAREIAKSNTRLLVLDEPSAVLTESEAENLLEVIQRIAARNRNNFYYPPT